MLSCTLRDEHLKVGLSIHLNMVLVVVVTVAS